MNEKYLLVIPAYNEGSNILGIINEANEFDTDILVIDDGSTDDTKAKLASLNGLHKIHHGKNLGYGKTLINSFQFGIEKGYDFLITMDSDGQHLPSEIPSFIKESKKSDIVSGSRYIDNSISGDDAPADRYKINKEITIIINKITKYGITDSFCGFKAYSINSLKKLNISETGYAMPLQVWIQAWKAGLKIKEIPVKRIYNDYGKQFGDGLDDPAVRLNYYNSIINKELNNSIVTNLIPNESMLETVTN